MQKSTIPFTLNQEFKYDMFINPITSVNSSMSSRLIRYTPINKCPSYIGHVQYLGHTRRRNLSSYYQCYYSWKNDIDRENRLSNEMGDEYRWIEATHSYLPMSRNEREKVIRLWKDFYSDAQNKVLQPGALETCYQDNWGSSYKKQVFGLLDKSRGESKTNEDLRKIQLTIEKSTHEYDEESLYKTVPSIMRMLIVEGEVSAKGYILGRKKKLSDIDAGILEDLGKYTLSIPFFIFICGNLVELSYSMPTTCKGT